MDSNNMVIHLTSFAWLQVARKLHSMEELKTNRPTLKSYQNIQTWLTWLIDSCLNQILQVGDYSRERPSGLTKKIKKLRRNWSLKKEDISKGLSKIKKSSKTLIEEVIFQFNSKSQNSFQVKG